jgi:hypothetical protein
VDKTGLELSSQKQHIGEGEGSGWKWGNDEAKSVDHLLRRRVKSKFWDTYEIGKNRRTNRNCLRFGGRGRLSRV